MKSIETTASGASGLPPRGARAGQIEFTACGPRGTLTREGLQTSLFVYGGAIAVRLLVKVWARLQARPDVAPTTGPLLLAGAVLAAGFVAFLFWQLFRRKDYWAAFFAGALAFASFFRFDAAPLAAGTPLEKPLILLPLLPAGIAIAAFLAMVRSADELQQRILYQALAFGFVVTFVATLVFAVLEDLGFPHVSAVWWWITLVVSWGVGLAASARRYR
ncbi:MAG TPA: hypothetical protein VFF17_06440 [Thermoanaerobaculia bacterium]|nr:hypothetical protein [Thermoanaerobaculia bacterium]